MRVVRRLALRDATGNGESGASMAGRAAFTAGARRASCCGSGDRSRGRERDFSWIVREAPDRRGRGVSLERTQR